MYKQLVLPAAPLGARGCAKHCDAQQFQICQPSNSRKTAVMLHNSRKVQKSGICGSHVRAGYVFWIVLECINLDTVW